jgi:hypothetical protein
MEWWDDAKPNHRKKPVPIHRVVADVRARWKQNRSYHALMTGPLPASITEVESLIGAGPELHCFIYVVCFVGVPDGI